jgi:hypothetical protein
MSNKDGYKEVIEPSVFADVHMWAGVIAACVMTYLVRKKLTKKKA